MNTSLAPFIQVYNLLEECKKFFKDYSESKQSDEEHKLKKKSIGVNLIKSGKSKSDKNSTTTKFKAFNFQKHSLSNVTKFEMPMSHFTGQNFWILKATNLNRGRGIHVFRDLKSLKKLIEDY